MWAYTDEAERGLERFHRHALLEKLILLYSVYDPEDSGLPWAKYYLDSMRSTDWFHAPFIHPDEIGVYDV